MNIIDLAKNKIKNKNIKIIFPEGSDSRIIFCAKQLLKENLAKPILVFENEKQYKKVSEEVKEIEYIIIEKSKLKKEMIEYIKTTSNNNEVLKNIHKANYFSTLMIEMKKVDVFLGGAVFSSADILRPIIKILRKEKEFISSFMLIQKDDRYLLFSDIAINIDPNAKQLSQIAIDSFSSYKNLFPQNEIIGSFLSFSTFNSAISSDVEKVRNAVKLTNKKNKNFIGEIQFDSAYDPKSSINKFPKNQKLPKSSDIYIFPDLQSANIAFKVANKLGGLKTYGPFIQGLKNNEEINDLSRSSSKEEIFETAIISLYKRILKNEQKRN